MNRKPPTKRPFDTQTDSDVKIEDYQITRDGRIIDGSLGKNTRPNVYSPPRDKVRVKYDEHKHMHGGDSAPAIRLRPKHSEDSFACFGKYVAALMRHMKQREAITLQGEIVNMLVEANMHERYEE